MLPAWQETKRMQIKVKKFSELTPYELYGIMKLRVDVFVVEQKCLAPE